MATVAAPIQESQINAVFYVAGGAYTTIQAAIDYARTQYGGVGQIVIGQGATTTENIAALTGGTPKIYITDTRDGMLQNYVWSGTAFKPADFVQAGPIAAPAGNFTNLMADAANFDTLSTTQLVADTGEFATSITAPAANLDAITAETGEFDAITADTGEFATSITAPTATIPDLTGNVTVEGLLKGMKKIRAYGFMPIDLTAAHVSIGTSNGGTIPIASFTDAAAPVNQKIWSIAALTDQMLFTCDDDNGTNYPWMTVTRSGHTTTGIALAAPLTLPGDPALPAQAATKNYVDDAIAESGNFVYPGAGVTVSTGSAWGTPINPATLAFLNAANTFTAAQTINNKLTLSGDVTSQGNLYGQDFAAITAASGTVNNKTTIRTLPGAGTAINPPGTGRIFFCVDSGTGVSFMNGSQSEIGSVTQSGAAEFAGNMKAKTLCATGSDPQSSAFNMDYSPTGDGAAWGRLLAVSATASSVAPDMLLITLSGDGSDYQEFLRYRRASRSVNLGVDVNIAGNLTVAGDYVAINGNQLFLGNRTLASRSLFPSISSDGTNIFLNPMTTGQTYLNWDQGNAGVVFGNGSGGQVGHIDSGGNLKCNSGTFAGCGVKDANSSANAGFTMNGSSMYFDAQGADTSTIANIHFRVFNQGASTIIDAFTIASNGDAHVYGTLSAGTKSFRIPHPLDKKKMLTHGSLEGPEHGVFYRGEVKCSKGQATVTLPDYFEALTEKEGRTILLTQVDDDSIDFAMLTATRISKGKFTIKSSEEDAAVYWEVKATRASTPITVVSNKEKAP